MGISFEFLYVYENNEIKFAVLDPLETFIIYDNSIEQNALAGVRFMDQQNYNTDEIETYVEVYTSNTISTFKMGEEDLELIDEKSHYFQEVPILCYENNFDGVGDWEKVMDLIDSYDLLISENLNNFRYFSDCYMVLTNVDNLTEEDIALMKERRVIVLPENSEVDWLTKTTENMEIESFKQTLKDNIFSFSQVPDINDKAFNQGISGEALKYQNIFP